MNEKVDRNKRLYQYHLQHPNMSYAKLGRVFKHKYNGTIKALGASAVYRILRRETDRLEIDLRGSEITIVEGVMGQGMCNKGISNPSKRREK